MMRIGPIRAPRGLLVVAAAVLLALGSGYESPTGPSTAPTTPAGADQVDVPVARPTENALPGGASTAIVRIAGGAASEVPVGGTEVAPPVRPAPTAEPAAPEEAPRSAAGMIIAIDPESGMPVQPSAEQMRRLQPEAARLDRPLEDLQPVELPDGSVMIDLRGRFMEYSVARIDASGKLRLQCVSGEEGVERLLQSGDPAPASQPVEE